MYEGMAEGLQLLLTTGNMLYLVIGILVGVLMGFVPGFNPSTAMVVALPFSYILGPATAIIFLSGIAGAGIYGGSITAILFKTPGTICSLVTSLDGYEMTRKGQGVRALAISGTASSIGGLLAGGSLLLIAPPLAEFATKFSFPEMFLLIIWAFAIVGAISGSLLKALASGVLGMLLASIGADPMGAYPRMTFGIYDLYEGIPLLTAIMGVFCFSEMIRLSAKEFIVEDISTFQGGYSEALKGVLFTLRRFFLFLRGSAIGIIVGAIPMAGAGIANMLAYAIEKNMARHPEEYGRGKPEGVLAAEAANNATEGSCMIPALTLGIPGSNIAAVLLAAMMIHGILPGPRIFHDYGPIIYAFIFAIIIANPIMFAISFLLSKYLGRMTTLSVKSLIPYILVFIITGTFAVRNSTFDLLIMVIFGVLAYFMEANGYSVIAFVLPFILGRDLERSFLIAMKYSGNNPVIFFKSHLCMALWLLILLTIIVPKVLRRKVGKEVPLQNGCIEG